MLDQLMWSKQEEEKITELMHEEVVLDGRKTGRHPDRPEAIRMMQRLKQSKKWSPNERADKGLQRTDTTVKLEVSVGS
jgi:hypothetical protein